MFGVSVGLHTQHLMSYSSRVVTWQEAGGVVGVLL